jgi:hypothetical protein
MIKRMIKGRLDGGVAQPTQDLPGGGACRWVHGRADQDEAGDPVGIPHRQVNDDLVSRVVNQMKISGQVVENLVRSLGPDERLGILIPRIDPGPKVGLQLGDAAVG